LFTNFEILTVAQEMEKKILSEIEGQDDAGVIDMLDILHSEKLFDSILRCDEGMNNSILNIFDLKT